MSIQIRFKELLGFAVAIAILALTTGARADDDALTNYRERFKTGFAHYKAGEVAEAIRYWEPIYRELGASKGYRLAFNLARAYETYGDFTRAAEFYQSFLAEAEVRRRVGQALEPLVEKESVDAHARLSELTATKGRIQVNAGAKPVSVRIDAAESRLSGFVAFVPPGAHTVTLGVESQEPEKREITVNAGEIVEVTPLPSPAPKAPQATPVAAVPLPPPIRMEKRIEHPFSPEVLYIAGGITVVSVLVPVITHASALSYQQSHSISSDRGTEAQNASVRSDYASASTAYYATLAVPITLGAVTAGLTAWYFLGAKQREIPVLVPSVDTRGGASLAVSGRF